MSEFGRPPSPVYNPFHFPHGWPGPSNCAPSGHTRNQPHQILGAQGPHVQQQQFMHNQMICQPSGYYGVGVNNNQFGPSMPPPFHAYKPHAPTNNVQPYFGSLPHFEDSNILLGGDTISSSNTQQESTSLQETNMSTRERVNNYIDRGKKRRIPHPSVKIKPKFKLDREKLKELGYHPVYDPNILPRIDCKTLPANEMLPEDEVLGGYIFMANNVTLSKQQSSKVFELPARYKDSVRCIRPGLPIFLYNYDERLLYGIYKAADFGTYDIQSENLATNEYPAHVKIQDYFEGQRIISVDEEDFRYACTHYDIPKFCLELSISQALDLIVLFEENLNYPNHTYSYCHNINQ